MLYTIRFRLRREQEELGGSTNPNSADDTAATSKNTTTATAARGSFHAAKGVTFRDVVEDIARHHGIPFYPKGSGGGGGGGAGASADGKVIFVLGEEQIYLDSNVVYVCRRRGAGGVDGGGVSGGKEDVWQPTSLDDLVSSMGC